MEDLVTAFILGIVLLINLIVLSYYLTRLKVVNRRIKESSEIVEDILLELRNRLNNQDQKILDQKVKVDILELKVGKILQTQEKKHVTPTPSVVMQPLSQVRREGERRLTDVEEKILKMLEEKPCTTGEIKKAIGRSREHTARIMKKLFDEGYIHRDESKRPYTYRIRLTPATFEAG